MTAFDKAPAPSAARIRAIESGETKIVGVNVFTTTEDSPLSGGDGEQILTVKDNVEYEQIERLKAWRQARDGKAARAALEDLRRRDVKFTVRGFLWMQGEADAKHAGSATEYAASLKRLKRRLEEDLGVPALPFVFGQVLPHEPAMDRFTHRREIRESQRNADEASGHADAIPGVKMVSTDGFPLKPDTVHYTAPGLARLGRAFAEAMAGMVKM